MTGPQTLFDKVWAAHEVVCGENRDTLLWVDRHYVHEGSFHAFTQLDERGESVAEPDLTFAMADHSITPVVTAVPPIFAVGQTVSMFVGISNGNGASTEQIQPGDAFTFTFDAACGTAFSPPSPVVVNSATLNAADFQVGSRPTNRQFTITYNGIARMFAPGDSFIIRFRSRPPRRPGRAS